jgi:hypothetical protein
MFASLIKSSSEAFCQSQAASSRVILSPLSTFVFMSLMVICMVSQFEGVQYYSDRFVRER